MKSPLKPPKTSASRPIDQAILGVLGRAQRLYGMVVHLAVVLSNHYHLLVAPTDAKQLADFMGFVNSNIAREVGRLVDWKEKFWSSRYQGIVVSDEVSAQLGRLEYFLANCVKENLVEKPNEWPGVHCVRALIEGQRLEGVWFDRTSYSRAQRRLKAADPPVQESDFKTIETLELSPLPCLANLGAAQLRDLIQSTIEKIVATAAAARVDKGAMVLGAARLQRQHPHTQPKRVKKSPAPRFHAFAVAVRRAPFQRRGSRARDCRRWRSAKPESVPIPTEAAKLRGSKDFQQLFEGSSFKHLHIDIEGLLASVTLGLDA